MNKAEFLSELRDALSGIPQSDAEERVSFYGEMIDDRMEEGLTEEEAVAGLGSVGEIVSQIAAETPITKLVREKIMPKRRLRGWEIALIVLGFPVWFPLLAAFCAVVLSLYVVVWALIVSLWAVEISLWAGALCALGASVVYFFSGYALSGIAALGGGLFIAGLSVFAFFGCVAASRGIVRLTGKTAVKIKSKMIRKEKTK